MKQFFFCLLFIITLLCKGQNPVTTEIECNPVWQQNILGGCIGANGMYIGDYNANGREELILHCGGVCNIVEYVPSTQLYEVIWGSEEFGSLYEMVIADGDNDGSQDIILLHHSGQIEIYDFYTHEHKGSYQLSYDLSWHNNLVAGDFDNDGLIELVKLLDDDFTIYRILNNSLEEILTINHSATDGRCGDINGDGLNELVLNSGHIYSINNGQYELQWDFLDYSQYFGPIELADTDNDMIPEIISVYNGFRVFDGDTQTLKWQLPTVEAAAVVVNNLDNTGLPEIIYVEDQWGDVVCVEPLNGAELWRFENPEHGATNIRVGDTDGDGNKEFMYATGCGISGPHHLMFFRIPDLTMEYISVYDQGFHNVIRIADVDEDGSNELITLSHRSETYGTGIISEYNAETKQLKRKSNDSLTWLQNFGMYSMQIADVDNDQDFEYVIASGDGYHPAISVINARTHQLDTVKVWDDSWASQPFYALTIADLDGDGVPEYIAASEDSLSIINSQTLEKIRNYTDNSIYQFATPVAGNIDSDSHTELVYVKYNVFIVDGVTEETWVVETGDRFVSCLLYDYNNDSLPDIIATTYDGKIYKIDGITHEETIIGNTGMPVTDMQMANLSGNTDPEFIYTYNKKLYVMNSQGDINFTNVITNDTYWNINCEITDYNNDGTEEIFIGCGLYVQELDAECYSCINLDADVESTATICNGSTGTATVLPYGGSEPYTFLWSNGSTNATVENLAAGTYQVTITDNIGCTSVFDIEVPELAFEINSLTINPDNIYTDECEGSITFHTSGGTPPYYCNYNGFWYTLTDSTLYELCFGNYLIDLHDANYCFTDAVVYIPFTTAVTDHTVTKLFTLYPNPSNGTTWLSTNTLPKTGTYAEISTMQGLVLNRIPIIGQNTLIDLSQLSKGIYLITLITPEGTNTRRLVMNGE